MAAHEPPATAACWQPSNGSQSMAASGGQLPPVVHSHPPADYTAACILAAGQIMAASAGQRCQEQFTAASPYVDWGQQKAAAHSKYCQAPISSHQPFRQLGNGSHCGAATGSKITAAHILSADQAAAILAASQWQMQASCQEQFTTSTPPISQLGSCILAAGQWQPPGAF